MKRIILLSLCACALSAACQKIDSGNPGTEEPTAFTISKDTTKFSVTKACWFSSNVTGFEDLYSKALFQTGGIDNSEVELIVMDMAGFDTYNEYLSGAYDNGCVIIVLNPDNSRLQDLMSEHDWIQMIPAEKEDVILYAFCQHGAYALNRIGEKIVIDEDSVEDEPFELDEEKKSDTTGADLSGEDTFVDPTKGIDFTQLGYYMAPFTKWVNEHLGLTSVNADPQSDYKVTFQHQHTYQCRLFVYQCSRHSDKDEIVGNLPMVARYEIQPYYVYPRQNYPEGDFYMVKTNYSCEMNIPGGIFQGDDRIQQHLGVFVHICGAFLRNFDVKTYVSTSSESPKLTFYPTGTPKPTTDINTTNYSHSTEHTISAGVTGGGGKAGKEPKKEWLGSWDLKGHLNYGYKTSNSISYSVKDLSVRNNSSATGATAAWEFQCNNLPKPKGMKYFTCTIPGIARSSTLLDASWIWNAVTSEWTSDCLGDIVTEFNPTLGACCNGACVVSHNRTYRLKTATVSSKLVVPKRIPFGTISFDNRFKADTLISNISAVYKGTHGKQEEVFKSSGDFSREFSCKCNLPEGPYEVTLDVTDASGNVKKFISKRNISLSRRLEESDIQHCTVSNALFKEVN